MNGRDETTRLYDLTTTAALELVTAVKSERVVHAADVAMIMLQLRHARTLERFCSAMAETLSARFGQQRFPVDVCNSVAVRLFHAMQTPNNRG